MKNNLIVKSLVLLVLVSFINPVNSFFGEEINIAYIKINEVSDEEGVVSTQPKKFRVIIDHDPSYISSQSKDSFDPDSSPLINNLSIIKRDLNRKKTNARNITADFEFEQERDSFDSPEHDGFLRTTFISNNQTIKKAQKMNFKLDLENYLRFIQKPFFSDIKTKISYRVDIKALELDFINLHLDDKSLIFSSKNPEKQGNVLYLTDNLTVLGTFNSEENLSDLVKQLSFETESASGTVIGPKLKEDATRTKNLNLEAISNGNDLLITSNGDGTYRVTIPLKFQTQNKLKAKQITLIDNYNLLVLPVILDIKTADNLDLNINGTLRETVSPSLSQ